MPHPTHLQLQLMSKSQTAILRTNFTNKLEERDTLLSTACEKLTQFEPEAASDFTDQVHSPTDDLHVPFERREH